MNTGKMIRAIYISAFAIMSSHFGQAQLANSTSAPAVISTTVADIGLSAAFKGSNIEVKWHKLNRTVKRYELEKSADGEQFSYLAALPGKTCRGFSYSVSDNHVNTERNHYRVKVVDSDGHYTYSKPFTVDTKQLTQQIKLMPTQVNNKLFVWVPANTSISTATISNAGGRKQQRAVINNGSNLVAVEISSLPAGIYSLSLQTNKGESVKLIFSRS